MNKLQIPLMLIACFCLITSGCNSTNNQDSSTDGTSDNSNNNIKTNSLNDVFWGDTHLHTDISMDAGAFGNRIGMEEAYRFASGEEVTASGGLKAKLSRPLDFLVVADHSDGMGLFPALVDKEEWVMKTPEGQRWAPMIEEGRGAEVAIELIKKFSQGEFSFKTNDATVMTPVWNHIVDMCEKYNDPGKFTALHGYEWTSLITGNNLHRVVIYRDNADKVRDHLPYTLEDSPDPEDLWKNMALYEKNTGGKVLAIAHNGNLSNGMMFADTTLSGDPLDEAYVKERIKREPLYEITQIKGDGETHPFLSPNDEFADFENWDYGNLDLSTVKSDNMLAGEYGRYALRKGIKYQKTLGTNPFKFGLIGSTDSHTSLATADDDNFFGKASNVEPNKDRANHPFVPGAVDTIYTHQTLASGYAAVWAESNTREALFDAMARKETYATTGSRMKVRFFGGWEYSDADMNDEYVQTGYDKGVPMGGDLGAANGDAPNFMINVTMDPEGGSLDRVQVIKGWVNEDGSTDEMIYEVAWAGDREIDGNGKLPSVGNSVNLEDASWDNSTGAPELKAVWSDPNFDAGQNAFYYVRVLEIPTPKWTLHDKLRYGAELGPEVLLTTTERAYTSPIWYTAP